MPQEHLYSMKSAIARYNKMGQGVILCLYDIIKFFDRENLRDCCAELYKLGINDKIYRLTYELNKETIITVRTPVGYTDSCNVGETVGQGTSESGVISSASLSGGVSEAFHDSKSEADYAGLKLSCCLFQDDIARLAISLEAVEEGNRRLEHMAESKLLDFHESKSGMILIGTRKFKNKITESLAKHPVTLSGKPMKIFASERWLGDHFGSSLSESVFLTIQKRKGMIQRLISEIRITINDCRSNTIGGLLVGLEIWQKAFCFQTANAGWKFPRRP